jgi:uncharacterized lipoprotein YehR (DUF1307 family)
MKTFRLIHNLLIIAILSVSLSGCATAPPRPKTVGEVVGQAVDTTIAWTSMGVQKIMNK